MSRSSRIEVETATGRWRDDGRSAWPLSPSAKDGYACSRSTSAARSASPVGAMVVPQLPQRFLERPGARGQFHRLDLIPGRSVRCTRGAAARRPRSKPPSSVRCAIADIFDRSGVQIAHQRHIACPLPIAFSSTPRWLGSSLPLAARPRITARSIRCRASSRLMRRISAARLTLGSYPGAGTRARSGNARKGIPQATRKSERPR